MLFSTEVLENFEKCHGFLPFMPTPRHSGRYPWREISPEELPEEDMKKELKRLRDKGWTSEHIAERTGIDIYIVAKVLSE